MVYQIEIENATVSYREHVALKGISLQIRKGTFVSVIGPNGAGKTTLLTLINGLGKIRGGKVRISGVEVSEKNIVSFRKQIGYVPQHLTIDPRTPLSVLEAVMLGRYGLIGPFKFPTSADREKVQNACKMVGIMHLLKKPIGHLSGGEQQKVSIARALAQEPEILLLDEPTANLDPRAQHEIIALIEKIFLQKGLTVVFVTHILSHLPSICSDAVLLKDGHIIDSGKAEDVLTEKKLSLLYDYPVNLPSIGRT